MALSPHEHLRLCGRCDGIRPYGSVLGACSGCGGSGFDNATSREAFEREHRQSAQPLPRQEDDPRVLTLLP